jgi:hypothetical protein
MPITRYAQKIGKQHNLTVFGSKTTGRPREMHFGFDIIITL